MDWSVLRNLSGPEVLVIALVLLASAALAIKSSEDRWDTDHEVMTAVEEASEARPGNEPPCVVAVLHPWPPVPHLDGVRSLQAEACEEWLHSRECNPAELGFRPVDADVHRYSSGVADKLLLIERGAWPGAVAE